jgi:hypothetical protein
MLLCKKGDEKSRVARAERRRSYKQCDEALIIGG